MLCKYLQTHQKKASDKIVLVATDNTTVVLYINKEGGMRSGPLCALLWRILTLCTRIQVTLKARHIPGRLTSRGLPNNMQLSFQESAGQGGSRQCGPSSYTIPGPNSGQVPLSSPSIVLLFGQDLRQNKELVFVSFQKGFNKDISLATISSWIKQTVVLCFELSDQEAHTLHQVKAHDVRAFAGSKAFQST